MSEDVRDIVCDAVREELPADGGSCEIVILLCVRPCPWPDSPFIAAQWVPNWKGLASGEPLILSMLSFILGIRSVFCICAADCLGGYAGVFGGRDGANVDDEGTREVDGFDGDGGRGGAFEGPALNGGLAFGAGDEGTRALYGQKDGHEYR